MIIQNNLSLIPHIHEGDVICQRITDGYINATAMCKAAGKLFADYARLKSTSDFLEELSTDMGITISKLIQQLKGGVPALQGTWVHPDVAIHLAQWLSPKFAVQVSRWVREWLTGGKKPTVLPYHLQRYMVNRDRVPPEYFSIYNELTIRLIAPLETQGYTLPDKMVPDISNGRMFCQWLREVKGIDTDALPKYIHQYPDGRQVEAKLYPIDILPDFIRHFYDVWLPKRAMAYFKERDPAALPYLPKLLTFDKAA